MTEEVKLDLDASIRRMAADGIDAGGTPVRLVEALIPEGVTPQTPFIQTEALLAIYRDDVEGLTYLCDAMDINEMQSLLVACYALARVMKLSLIAQSLGRSLSLSFADILEAVSDKTTTEKTDGTDED